MRVPPCAAGVFERASAPSERCGGCRHWSEDHLLELGLLRLCLAVDCDCGRRSLAALARVLRPFWPVILAAGYFAFQLARWALLGFRVVG